MFAIFEMLENIGFINGVFHLTSGRINACASVQNVFQTAESEAGLGNVFPDATCVEVVRHWTAGGVAPHINGVFGGGGGGGGGRGPCGAPRNCGGLQLRAQHLKIDFV